MIAIDRVPKRLAAARDHCGAETIDYSSCERGRCRPSSCAPHIPRSRCCSSPGTRMTRSCATASCTTVFNYLQPLTLALKVREVLATEGPVDDTTGSL